MEDAVFEAAKRWSHSLAWIVVCDSNWDRSELASLLTERSFFGSAIFDPTQPLITASEVQKLYNTGKLGEEYLTYDSAVAFVPSEPTFTNPYDLNFIVAVGNSNERHTELSQDQESARLDIKQWMIDYSVQELICWTTFVVSFKLSL